MLVARFAKFKAERSGARKVWGSGTRHEARGVAFTSLASPQLLRRVKKGTHRSRSFRESFLLQLRELLRVDEGQRRSYVYRLEP
jgi:hypothetical protein